MKKGYKHSEETILAREKRYFENGHHMKGFKHSKKTKKIMSVKRKLYLETHPNDSLGKKWSEESKEYLSKVLKKKYETHKHHAKIKNPMKGKKHSKKSKRLMSTRAKERINYNNYGVEISGYA